MTSTTRDTVPEDLRNTIGEAEPPSIGKEPYVKNNKFVTDYLTDWLKNGSCMAFMEPGKKGVGVAMLIGAESGNIITYAMSNNTGRFANVNLQMLKKKVNTGWPTAASLRTTSKFVKPAKLNEQNVPAFFPLAANEVEVILNNEEKTPHKIMSEKDIKEDTKFWLKYAAGHGKDKNSSILAINLPTCTTISSTTLHEQIKEAWKEDAVMAAIPTALPAPPAANETTATAPTTAKETVAPSNEEEETTTTTTTDTEVKGCNVKFAKGTKPPTEQTIAAEKQMVPFQTNNNPNNGMGSQMGSQPSN